MKIIFFGTPEFAVKTLESLHASTNIKVELVVTQPDKAVGRKKIITPPPVKAKADELGIKTIQPKNKKELEDNLKEISADFFVVVAFGMILTPKTLKIPKYGSINLHASLLPNYRGASPIQEALLHGDKETGITIMKMDKELDHGPIYLLRKVSIQKEDQLESLSKKLAKVGAEIMPYALKDIMNKELTPIEQNHLEASYCGKIKSEDGKVNWNKSAKEIFNMVRAYNPWPSTFTEFKEKKLYILKSDFEEKDSQNSPGTLFLEENTLKIATKQGNIIPQLLKPEGKKEMNAKDFINGYKNAI
jgi:methionyl-tRNA formyltransferase